MLERFLADSWVAPQLAVALGILHEDRAVGEFERILFETSQQTRPIGPKTIFAAYAALKKLGHRAAYEFEASEFFCRSREKSPGTDAGKYQGDVSKKVADQFWEFWVDQVPLQID